MMRMFLKYYSLVTLVLLAIFAVGCAKRESLPDKLKRYAQLQGALESELGELSQMIASIQTQRLDPMHLDRHAIQNLDNAYPLLNSALAGESRYELYQRAEWLFDSEQFLYDPEVWSETAELLSKYSKQVSKIVEASDYDSCYFPVLHEVGHFDSKDYLDNVRIAVRILLVRAYDYAHAGESNEATKNLCRALTWAHWLSRVRKVESRVAGGRHRAHVLYLTSELFKKRLLTASDAEYLYNRLRDFLVDWPSDRRMLVGERSASLHSYEAIRSGEANRLLTNEEKDQFERLGRLDEFLEPEAKLVDRDELNYLRAMELHIQATENPYFSRRQAYKQAISISTSFPNLYAHRVFLIDLAEAEAACARDRALVEAWSLVLAESVGLNQPNFQFAPINGEPYEVTGNAVSVEVKIGDLEVPSVIVPRF